MFVLREIEVVLYISTITDFWLSEVKPPITYTPLSKFREVPSVHGLGIGDPIVQLFSNFCPCAIAAPLLNDRCTRMKSEIDISINAEICLIDFRISRIDVLHKKCMTILCNENN